MHASRSLIVGLCLLAATACSRAEQEPAGASSSARSVLLLTLDTTRADRLGCYGRKAARTPNLDRLAASGALFERAYTPAPLTLPAHASLLTGALPPEHGIHDNGQQALPASIPTLAEIFGARGYRTGAFVSAAVLDSAFGLARGFDVYDDEFARGAAQPASSFERTGARTADAALAWLKREPARPFFAWVHFYDPHTPYDAQAPFAQQCPDPYDAEIAAMDAQIGRLLEWVEAKAGAATLVVAVADHGEALGEHGEVTHGIFIYDSTMRVPLIMSCAGKVPARLQLATPVQITDVARTICALVGFETTLRSQGANLAPLFEGGTLAARELYGESEYCWRNFECSPLRSVRAEPWKYIDSSAPELFDLAHDAGEGANVRETSAQDATSMATRLARLRASFSEERAPQSKLDPGLSRAISSLGYAQGSAEPDAARANELPHPRERLAALNAYHEALSLGDSRAHAQRALVLLKEVVAAFPTAAGFRTELATAELALGELAQARAELETVLREHPEYAKAHLQLAQTLALQGEFAKSLREYEALLALRPDDLQAQLGMAAMLDRLGRLDEALAVLRALADRSPRDPELRGRLAFLLRAHGRGSEVLAVLRQAVEDFPQDDGLALYLAWELATQPDARLRDGARAVLLAERVVARSGRAGVDRLDTLAAAYAENGRFDEALATIAEALASASPDRSAPLAERARLYRARVAYRAP